jgi:hypothetical protein
VLAELILDGTTPTPIAAFDIARFTSIPPPSPSGRGSG